MAFPTANSLAPETTSLSFSFKRFGEVSVELTYLNWHSRMSRTLGQIIQSSLVSARIVEKGLLSDDQVSELEQWCLDPDKRNPPAWLQEEFSAP